MQCSCVQCQLLFAEQPKCGFFPDPQYEDNSPQSISCSQARLSGMFSPIYKPFLIFQSSEEDLPAEPIDAEQKSKQLKKKSAVRS